MNFYTLFPKVVFLFSLFILLNNYSIAQKKKNKIDFETEANLGFFYDDNILKYSDKYIDRFLNQQDEGRFHIKTIDDVIILTSVEMKTGYSFIKKRKTQLSGKFSRNNYIKNNIKSWHSFSFSVQQTINKNNNIKFSYALLPNFYVRHYRDAQWVKAYGYKPITFQPFSFAKESYVFSFQNSSIKKIRLRLTIDYSKYFHNIHYTEYDSKNLQTAFDLYYSLTSSVRINAGYHFEKCTTKGFDAAIETKNTSLGPDGSYIEDQFDLGAQWKIPYFVKYENSIAANVGFQYLYFTSPHAPENDPFHAHRIDKNIRFNCNYDIKFNKNFTISAFYLKNFRNSESNLKANEIIVSDEKDYNQNQIGIKAVYKFKK